MAETYSAGIVTAYGAAVRGGYKKTYEQWCQDMAQLGDNVAEVRTKAAQAAQSAENAAGSATAAAGSAGSAAGSASEAASSAGNAAGSATAAAESATNAASSAAAASASATAAGNAQTAAETAQGKAEDAQEAAEQAQSDAEAAAQSVSQSAAQISQNTSDIGDLKSAINTKAPAIIDSTSGAIASFPDGAGGLPIHKLTVDIEPVQAGSGDPSPDNVRPISGWTGCEVANISDGEKQPYFAGLLNGTYGFVDLGTLNWIYDTSAGIGRFSSSGISNLKSSTRLTGLICSKYVALMNGEAFDPSWDKVIYVGGSNVLVHDSSYTDTAVFKSAMSGVYLIYELATPTTPAIMQAQYNTLLQSFNLGGWLVPISWQSEAGTVYGGTLDVTTGLLTVDQVMVDMGDLTWVYEGVVGRCNRFYTASLSEMKLDNSDLGSGLGCSIYKIDGAPVGGSGVNNTICHYDRLIFVNNNAYSNADTFKAAMSGAQLVYELATPQTYQLTPQEVTTLLGQNNIWADTGGSTVEYPCDTKLYIQKINAPADDDMTADAQIASGKYFIIGNNLYLSTTTIPAGDTIIPGTNCTKTDLAAALNALNI